MRRILPLALLVAASSLAVSGSVARANNTDGSIIASSAAGALLPPELWDCDLYFAEYDQFIGAGNKPELWRFFGKRYRHDTTGEIYDWQMWLEWRQTNNCAPLGPIQSVGGQGSGAGGGGGGGFGGMTAVGIVGGLLATGAIAAGGGGGGGDSPPPKSPG